MESIKVFMNVLGTMGTMESAYTISDVIIVVAVIGIIMTLLGLLYEKNKNRKNRKLFIIGSSGSGKVFSYIKPNLPAAETESLDRSQGNHLIDMSELAIKVKDYPELPRLMMLNDMPAKFKYLVELKENVPADLYAAYARWSYQMSTLDVPLELLYQVFDNVDRNLLMSENEQETFNSLPEYITIYRGTKYDEDIPRLSWSRDKNIAMKYYQGRLFKAIVKKEEIIACFSDDCENEVLAYVPENFEIIE